MAVIERLDAWQLEQRGYFDTSCGVSASGRARLSPDALSGSVSYARIRSANTPRSPSQSPFTIRHHRHQTVVRSNRRTGQPKSSAPEATKPRFNPHSRANLTASAANTSGFLQTPLSKATRRSPTQPHSWPLRAGFLQIRS